MSGLPGLSLIALVGLTLVHGVVPAARLRPETVVAWDGYVREAERRIAGELDSSRRFLALDFDDNAGRFRREVLAGAVPIEAVHGPDAGVPSGHIHHWRGAVFVPGASLEAVMAVLRTVPPRPEDQEDILASRMLETGPDRVKVFLKLRREKIVTVVFNTEHVVTFTRQGPGRATSRSVATRIAEVRDAGTPGERELPPGDDSGFLWRLNAYWRYQAVPGGIIAECESISLSRDVPAVVRFMVSPLINGAARESLERTLDAFRRRFAGDVRTGR